MALGAGVARTPSLWRLPPALRWSVKAFDAMADKEITVADPTFFLVHDRTSPIYSDATVYAISLPNLTGAFESLSSSVV